MTTWYHVNAPRSCHDAREYCTISRLSYTQYTECVRPYDSKWELDKLQYHLTLCWVYQVSGERFIWCGEVYRFIWDPAPATVSRVEIPEKFIMVQILDVYPCLLLASSETWAGNRRRTTLKIWSYLKRWAHKVITQTDIIIISNTYM